MLYHWYELNYAAMRPWRMAVHINHLALLNPCNPMRSSPFAPQAVAACEVFERVTRRYTKPSFGISNIRIGAQVVEVREEIIWRKPFCRLLAFRCEATQDVIAQRPNLLIVAPMSGHFSSLLRGTVQALLPTFNVFITDWSDARDVPLVAGRFDLDDFIDYVIDMLALFGGDVHVYAVCQPAVPVLAAVSLLEAAAAPSVPRSMVLTGGPIDTRVNATVLNELVRSRGTDWFRQHTISTVPWPNTGFGRGVYPGFLQLSGFMSMNLERHMEAHRDYFEHLVRGDGDSAEKHRTFYDDYLAVMDLTAEFFLQTVDTVFVRHALARGEMYHRGERVETTAVRRTALLTIEGGNDDIAAIGQCAAAHDLCKNLPTDRRERFVCTDVGHYGLFNGFRFRERIAPRIESFVFANDHRVRSSLPTVPEPDEIPSSDDDGLASLAFSFRDK